jgi:hypothetical protein
MDVCYRAVCRRMGQQQTRQPGPHASATPAPRLIPANILRLGIAILLFRITDSRWTCLTD